MSSNHIRVNSAYPKNLALHMDMLYSRIIAVPRMAQTHVQVQVNFTANISQVQ